MASIYIVFNSLFNDFIVIRFSIVWRNDVVAEVAEVRRK